jgi:hypothetical protein
VPCFSTFDLGNDAMLQLGLVALCQGDTQKLDQAYVPTFIKEVVVSGRIDVSAGCRFSAAAQANTHGFREVVASVSLLDQDSFAPVIQMEGVKCRAIASSPGNAARSQDHPLYEHVGRIIWEPDVELLSREQLNRVLRKPLGETLQTTRIRDLELLAYSFMHAALEEVDEKESMQNHHVQFFKYMQT